MRCIQPLTAASMECNLSLLLSGDTGVLAPLPGGVAFAQDGMGSTCWPFMCPRAMYAAAKSFLLLYCSPWHDLISILPETHSGKGCSDGQHGHCVCPTC